MSAHSKIGASSMHRWSACPGSVRLSEGIEQVSSAYAEEGTLAHDIAATMLAGQPPHIPLEFDGMDSVQTYVEYCRSVSKGATLFLIEHKFDLGQVYEGLFGTADCVVYHRDEKLLRVIDYKHGSGIPVEVFEDGKPNLQLTYYGLGGLLSTGVKATTVELTIVQPRCAHPDGPIRSHRFDALELIDFAADLVEAAKRTEDPNAPVVPGDHCRFCPAAATCPELHRKTNELAVLEFSPALSYDPVKLSQTLEWLPTIEAWVKSVRDFAYREAEHGRTPPGWKLVEKRATRKWRDEDAAAKELELGLGLSREEIFETSLKSPAQVEKKIPKEKRDLLETLVSKVSSGYALAHESDKRQAVVLDAATAFKNEDFKQLL